MAKILTADEAGRFYAPELVGITQRMTPEGYLLCEAVPIARTGELLYADGEVPVEADLTALVRISRNEDELFHPDTLASFEGKPVTIDHPDEFVSPENWRELSVGTAQNVRRGEGANAQFILADLLITDADAIERVRGGLREVSCGYEAEYEQVAPGRGVQRQIFGNHVAIVERGRCGPRCAIGDKEADMKKGKKGTFLDRLRALVTDAEEELKDDETKDSDDEDEGKEKGKTGDAATADRLTKVEDTLAALTKAVEKLATRDSDKPDETEDSDEDDEEETTDTVIESETVGKVEQGMTGDAAAALADAVARAEILAPGIQMPTRDAKAKTADTVAALQRHALTAAMQTAKGKNVVAPLLMGRDIKALTADALATVFVGASELVKAINNASATRDSMPTPSSSGPRRTADEIATMQKRNNEFWSRTGR